MRAPIHNKQSVNIVSSGSRRGRDRLRGRPDRRCSSHYAIDDFLRPRTSIHNIAIPLAYVEEFEAMSGIYFRCSLHVSSTSTYVEEFEAMSGVYFRCSLHVSSTSTYVEEFEAMSGVYFLCSLHVSSTSRRCLFACAGVLYASVLDSQNVKVFVRLRQRLCRTSRHVAWCEAIWMASGAGSLLFLLRVSCRSFQLHHLGQTITNLCGVRLTKVFAVLE